MSKFKPYTNYLSVSHIQFTDEKMSELLTSKFVIEKELLTREDCIILIMALIPVADVRIFLDTLHYPNIGYSRLTRLLNKLVEKKYLNATGLNNKRWYHISNAGLQYAENLAGDRRAQYGQQLDNNKTYNDNNKTSLGQQLDNIYKVRKKVNSPAHELIVSKLICTMLLGNEPFNFSVESIVKDSALLSYLASLKTDLFIHLPNRNKAFSMEVDTGTETIGVLIDKVYKYCQSEYTFSNTDTEFHQLFFIFDKTVGNACEPTVRNIQSLYSSLEDNNILTLKKTDIDRLGKVLTVGEYAALKYLYEIRISEMVYERSNNILNSIPEIDDSEIIFDLQYVKEFFSYSSTAPLAKIIDDGKRQYNFYKKRMLSLAHRYCNYIAAYDKGIIRNDCKRILDGFNILASSLGMFETTMYIDLKELDKTAALYGTYADSESEPERLLRITSEEVLTDHVVDIFPLIHTSRAYYFKYEENEGGEPDYENNIITLAEDLSNNISGYVRAYTILRNAKGDINLLFMGVVNSHEDAVEFLDFVNEDRKLRRDEDGYISNGVRIIFVLKQDIGTQRAFMVKNKDDIVYCEI